MGDLAVALAWTTASRAVAEADGDWVGQLDAAHTLAVAHEARRDWPAMLAAAQASLEIAQARQHLHALALVLRLLGRPLAHLRQPERAVQLCAFAGAFWRRHLGQLSADDLRLQERVCRLARAQIGGAAVAAAWAVGEQLDREHALTLALQARA